MHEDLYDQNRHKMIVKSIKKIGNSDCYLVRCLRAFQIVLQSWTKYRYQLCLEGSKLFGSLYSYKTLFWESCYLRWQFLFVFMHYITWLQVHTKQNVFVKYIRAAVINRCSNNINIIWVQIKITNKMSEWCEFKRSEPNIGSVDQFLMVTITSMKIRINIIILHL